MAASAKMQEMAKTYGYEIAFFKTNGELWRVFNKSVNEGWDKVRFVAAVQKTDWYKAHSETFRQNVHLMTSDPATWNQKLEQQKVAISAVIHQMGATVGYADLKKMVKDSVLFGWTDQQVKVNLGHYITAVGGQFSGEAASTAQQLKQTLYRNGVNLPDSTLTKWVQSIETGVGTLDQYQQTIRDKYGASLAPSFKEELAAGQDLYDVATPYMSSMAKTLELNPAEVNLYDPTIRQALGTTGKDGASTPLWQFEQGLRKDTRWLQTKNAKDAMTNTTHNILQSFGLSAI